MVGLVSDKNSIYASEQMVHKTAHRERESACTRNWAIRWNDCAREGNCGWITMAMMITMIIIEKKYQ